MDFNLPMMQQGQQPMQDPNQMQDPSQQPMQGPSQQPMMDSGQGQSDQAAQNQQPFPATPAEAMQFSNDMLEAFTSDQIEANLTQQLQSMPEQERDKALGVMAGQFVGSMVANVRGQTGNRPFEMDLVLGAVRATINELAEMGADVGINFTNQEKAGAMDFAVRILDQAGRGQR